MNSAVPACVSRPPGQICAVRKEETEFKFSSSRQSGIAPQGLANAAILVVLSLKIFSLCPGFHGRILSQDERKGCFCVLFVGENVVVLHGLSKHSGFESARKA